MVLLRAPVSGAPHAGECIEGSPCLAYRWHAILTRSPWLVWLWQSQMEAANIARCKGLRLEMVLMGCFGHGCCCSRATTFLEHGFITSDRSCRRCTGGTFGWLMEGIPDGRTIRDAYLSERMRCQPRGRLESYAAFSSLDHRSTLLLEADRRQSLVPGAHGMHRRGHVEPLPRLGSVAG
jgi:hypothetical protein